MQNLGLEQELNEILKCCTCRTLAEYIARMRGETAKPKSDGGYQIGKQKDGGSTSVYKNSKGEVRATDFNGELSHASLLDWIEHLEGITDFAAKIERARQIVNATIVPTATNKPKSKKRSPETIDERRPIYEAFMRKYRQSLIDGLQSDECETVFKKRNFDASKVATLKGIGYCTKDTEWVNGPNPQITGFRVTAHSIVVWDDSECTIKPIPLLLETGKRNHKAGCVQLGSCHWMPFDELKDTVFLTEGETSAIALIFSMINNDIACAFPCKPKGNSNIQKIAELAKSKTICLAYDNDKEGIDDTQKSLKLAPNAIDISPLWSGDGWEPGDDPNNFIIEMAKQTRNPGEIISEFIQNKARPGQTENEQTQEISNEQTNQETAKEIDTANIEELQRYFLAKAQGKDSEFAKIAMNDDVVGGFVNLVDPYRMRSHAPIACMIAFAVAYLSNYRFNNLFTEARIINVVARSNGGKDWVLGTHEKSRSLYKQLEAIEQMSVDCNADASVTGNGMSKSAFLWAANPVNKGKIRCMFWPEFGNAQTRGYGQSERAGSIGNYDMMIGYKKIKKPQNKADLKELKDYENEYPFRTIEVRAFQGINGAKVVIPQFEGSGEARREFWFYMEKPEDDPLCNELNAPDFERLLKDSAFMPDKCDEAFNLLKTHALSFHPSSEYFGSPIQDRITIDSTSQEYKAAYQGLLGIVTNTFYRADKAELLRDKLQYCAALSAGLHGRTNAEPIDYQIGAYFCECLCDSLDRIMDAASMVDDPESERAKIMQRVRASGIKGVYKHKLSDNTKLLDELCGLAKTREGDTIFMPGAPLVRCMVANKRHLYIATEFVEQAKREHPKRNEIVFNK